jgi:Histidine kinase-like ATPase domain/MerR HTH family regulatory protein
MTMGMREIGEIARELGVDVGTLREWERRYSVSAIQRDARGRRLYDDGQVGELRRILAFVELGERAHLARVHEPATTPLRCLRLRLTPASDAPGRARRAVSDLLGRSDGPGRPFSVQLVASELVKNAVVYGSRSDPIELDLEVHQGWIELRVSNTGAPLRMKGLRRTRRNGGRGLEIMDALAWGWSIDTGPLGTTISARIPFVEGAGERFHAPGNGYGTRMSRTSRADIPERRNAEDVGDGARRARKS